MSVEFAEEVRQHLQPIDDYEAHPDNPRRGDVQALTESIETNGFYTVCLAQKSTKRIVAGNHRRRALREMGETHFPVVEQEMSDEDALRILLGDNRTSDLAYYDDPTLFKLLQDLDGDFAGTGYDRASYELLLQGMEGDEILGGVAQGYVPEDREAAYLDSDIRSIILPYQGEDYDEVAVGLQQLRKDHDLETNSEVVAMLVERAST